MKDRILKLSEDLRDDITNFTREMIAIPSLSGKEDKVIRLIKQKMEKLGFEKVQNDKMGNLIGQIGDGKHILAFDGHADTVEVGSLEAWKYDPFEGKIEKEIIYGRGACDQKGGIASLIYSGYILQKIGIPKDTTFLIVVGVQEELFEGLNWQFIVKEMGILPDAVVLTEPTGLRIAIGQKGRIDLKIKTNGISSHGAAPDEGENAIYKIVPIIQDIQKLHKMLPSDPIFGKACISVTGVRSTSPAVNAIADSAIINVDRRLISQETLESVITEINSLSSIKMAKAQVYVPEYEYKSNKFTYPIKAYYPSWIMEKNHPFIQTAARTYQQLFGQEAEFLHWHFSTNGAATKGIFEIPTLGFGPGYEKFAHTTEDQVPIDHLIKAMQFYASLAKNWQLTIQ
ncbi:MAG: YgeY family selenium metabolism-linked hydrolase [Candidatus Hodarchaeota archaeon]